MFPEGPKEVARLEEQVVHTTGESRKPWCEMQTQITKRKKGSSDSS